MARTTSQLVSGIIAVEGGDDLTPFIDTANMLVTELCTGSGYGNPILEMIERWLSAHFYDIFSPRTSQEGINPGPTESFERVQVDIGLNNTKYGQQAMRLDYKGNLAGMENLMKKIVRRKVSANWLGEAPADATVPQTWLWWPYW